MSLPGLALPGLEMNDPTNIPDDEAEPTIRLHTLPPASEYRFEASFTRKITIKVLTGNAELFGTELAPNTVYTFRGAKGAIFSWQGATLEVGGDPEADYVAEETPMTQYVNSHFGLEALREQARSARQLGPRILVVGPDNAGKSSLVKILTGHAIKAGRQPCVVNLDPEQGLLTPPGGFSITSFGSIVDVEEGWGSSPISGPTALPVKMPIVYHFGCRQPMDQEKLFKALITRMAIPVLSRMGEDDEVKEAGCVIDTPGSLAQGKGNGYDLISHIVSEFSVTVIFVLGSERLFSEMKRRFGSGQEEPIAIVKLDKSGGCVDRDAAYMKQLRQAQIYEYFFGRGSITLSPYSQFVDFSQMAIYKVLDDSQQNGEYGGGGGEDDDDEDYAPSVSIGASTNASRSVFLKVEPSMSLQNCLLAITHADPNASQATIRDSSVMGYVFVAEVDEIKKKVKLLCPVGGRVPSKAMIWGSWPEDVLDLLN